MHEHFNNLDMGPLIGLACFFIIVGLYAAVRDMPAQRRQCKRRWLLSDEEIDKRLRATSPFHWRKCPKCHHWSFGKAMCMRDNAELNVVPTRDEVVAFQSQLLPVWQELAKNAPGVRYNENEIAGLFHLRQKVEASSK